MLFLSILFACGDKTTDTSNSSDTAHVSEPEHAYHGCPGQAQEQCDDFSHCTSIFASTASFNEQEQCWSSGDSEYVGCRGDDSACGEAITFAQSPEDQVCYIFTNTCIPEGWTECSDVYLEECAQQLHGAPIQCSGMAKKYRDLQNPSLGKLEYGISVPCGVS